VFGVFGLGVSSVGSWSVACVVAFGQVRVFCQLRVSVLTWLLARECRVSDNPVCWCVCRANRSRGCVSLAWGGGCHACEQAASELVAGLDLYAIEA